MKDVVLAVSIFHTISAIALFAMMAVTVVNVVSNRVHPKG